ncbi:MAG: mucin desulfatase, partial [Oscillospiraceae bacterium]|nr:mucin desulfatase [Oscillospiraceae bacterium]
MNFYYPEKDSILVEVLGAYDFPATLLGAARYGQGHINDTFCVICQPQEGDAIRFILQGLSLAAFPHPDELMENFIGITSYLREKVIANGGDPLRETLSLVKTKDGKDYYTDSNGKVWRLTPFIENTDCFQSATPELFEASARSFGRFQYMLQGYPAETLHEAIVNFHNTEDRYAKFEAALAADKHDRAKDIAAEIKFVTDRKADCSVALQALRDGKLPLRVT